MNTSVAGSVADSPYAPARRRDSGIGRQFVPARLVLLAALLLFTSGCGVLRGPLAALTGDRTAQWAAQTTIVRDEWGVPHIQGPTDASVVFGLAYAQAEDNMWQIEEDLLRAIGRAAYVYGDGELDQDLVRAAFDVERLSREEYEREPPERKTLWDAFAAGLNHYLATHPEYRPRGLWHYEPWFVFARFRTVGATSTIDGVRLGGVREIVGLNAASSAVDTGAEQEDGSNAWAIAPNRTANGHALLFQNPHVGFFGAGQRYEAHLHSEEGLQATGFAILGTPMLRSGRNAHLAWVHTNSASDTRDVYIVKFDHPTDPLAYRHGDEWRRAERFTREIAINSPTGVQRDTFTFLRTHHGPIVQRRDDGNFIAARVARMEEGGLLQQWYAMGRARSLDDFRAALAQTAIPGSNTMYADVAGNIYYVHGNAVPRRAPSIDPSQPLDGADPAADWHGQHELEELPQLLNPPSGWLQNTNATPFLAAGRDTGLDRDAFPRYMAPDPDNGRARISRRILAADSTWTLDELADAAFDTYMIETERWLPELIDEYERLGALEPERAFALDAAIDRLRAWDGRAALDSEATTLFVLWLDRARRVMPGENAWPLVSALERVIAELDYDWERSDVAWGDMNRLQRVHTSGTRPFDETAPSLAVPGAPGWTGTIFAFSTRRGLEGRRYGTSGHTWVSVAELSDPPRSRSVVTFGQSADPESPHYFDQAQLYVEGRFKDVHFEQADVWANARRAYHPDGRIIEVPR